MDAKYLIENADYTPDSYSGRGMYGKVCLSFTTDDSPFTVASKLISAYGDINDPDEYDLSELAKLIAALRSDGMGLGNIYYLPRVEWKD